jgi:hypothetical protein
MADRERSPQPPAREGSPRASGATRTSGVPLVGTGVAPIAPDDGRAPETGKDLDPNKDL